MKESGISQKILDIDRLFSDPNLNGLAPVSLKFSPDSKRITFLRGKIDNYEKQDLFEYNIGDKQVRLLVDSNTLISGHKCSSSEEIARRERMRIFATGIVEYHWSHDGNALVFPLNDDLYYYDLKLPHEQALRRLTDSSKNESDIKFSPKGNFISFIREQNLFIVDLHANIEKQITYDGGGCIINGVAEFIAQEEMNRFTGYWWSYDDSHIAFTQTDESTIKVSQRYEITAEAFEVYDQRYPYAGTPNVRIRLGIANLTDGQINWIDLGEDKDIYLARVDWLPDNRHLAVQLQSRSQKILKLIFFNIEECSSKKILQEHSDRWINLHNDLRFLKSKPWFVWTSERSGYKHIYLYDTNGNLIGPITTGLWNIHRVVSLNEEDNLVYFEASMGSPLEKHLFTASMEESESNVTQITQIEGWHIIDISNDNKYYIDNFSNPRIPPQVSLHKINGENIVYIDKNILDKDHPYFPYFCNHSAPEFSSITAMDGQNLYYRLIKPVPFNPQKKYPVIVNIYGGPGLQKVIKNWGSLWEQYLANQGYVVFQLDNRGTTNRGKAFENPIYLELGKIEIEDQVIGVEFLKSLSFVDGTSIGVIGHSYGGYLTILMLAKAPGLCHAGVSIAPVTDWYLYDTHYTERYLGNPADNRIGYENSCVFQYISNIKDNLLVIHGMADDNVLFINSTKLFKSLQDSNIMFEMMCYPGSKHGLIANKKVGTHLYHTIANFFERNLK